ncbi:hypothetical protein HD593_006633 [Nonomuraea rubra]|uniref:Uncharacterized protein n=1 Tax=Nonomuraea rubra TaxID=46180 RepID=A0A7X0NY79_9ACTN|nr:hypothetical protein [Nonomuraea rubra]
MARHREPADSSGGPAAVHAWLSAVAGPEEEYATLVHRPPRARPTARMPMKRSPAERPELVKGLFPGVAGRWEDSGG